MCAEILKTGSPSVEDDSLLLGHSEERRLVRLADEAAARAPQMEEQLKQYIATRRRRCTKAAKQAVEAHLKVVYGYVSDCQMLYKEVEEDYLPAAVTCESGEGEECCPPPPQPHTPEKQCRCCEQAALAVLGMAKLMHDSVGASGMSNGRFEAAIEGAWGSGGEVYKTSHSMQHQALLMTRNPNRSKTQCVPATICEFLMVSHVSSACTAQAFSQTPHEPVLMCYILLSLVYHIFYGLGVL
jgi:hypothetical protein